MGQFTTVVMIGGETSYEDLYDDEEFAGPGNTWRRSSESEWLRSTERGNVHGFVVALSNGSVDGVPNFDLVGPVPLDEFATTEPFKQSVERARGLWEEFRAHALALGVPLPNGRLYLAEIEVA